MIKHLLMPHPVAGTRLRHQIRGIAHAFHPTRDHDLGGTRQQRIVREDGGLHGRATHLVDCCARGREWQPGLQRGLSRRRLALARRQHTAEDRLVDIRRGDARALHRRLDGDRTEITRGQRCKITLEAAHRCARRAHNHNRIDIHLVSYFVSLKSSRPINIRRISEVPAPIS